MEKLMKTTGKDYSEENTRKCCACGEIFNSVSNVKCPICGSENTEHYQRTLATISEEKKSERESSSFEK